MSNCKWGLIGIALLLVMAAPAMAAPCTESGSRGPVDIRVPDIVAPRDAPNGTVLARVVSDQSSYWLECSGPNNTVAATLMRRFIGGNIMEVLGQDGQPIPGLGMRVQMSSSIVRGAGGECIGGNLVLQPRFQLNCQKFILIGGVRGGVGFGYGQMTLTFIKTASSLASTALAPDTVLSLRTDNYTSIPFRITGGRIISNPCTFNIPTNVSLGTMSAEAMNGGRSGAPTNFQMQVSCVASARYKLKFTPAGGSTAVSDMPGALSNSAAAGSAARNVNVQVQNEAGTPVPLNTDIDHGTQAATSVVNYWVSMVRAGSGAVAPGNVKAAAEVSFTFY